MDRLLARLDRRFGRYAIENLPMFIVGGMGIVFLIAYAQPQFLSLLTFSPREIARGQVWRVFTYLFLPTDLSIYWILFNLYFVWWVGSSVEAAWGAFKLNAYYLAGMLGTTAAAFIAGSAQGNLYLNLSLLLAFATLFPDYEILFFFIIRFPAKVYGWLAGAYVAYELAMADWSTRAAIIAALSNYLLFFSGTIVSTLRSAGGAPSRQGARRGSSAPPAPQAQGRTCGICGAREADGADIRVCSCEKCKAKAGGSARTLCLEHARDATNH